MSQDSPNVHFDALDSWRGVCACLVAIFHLQAYGPIFASPFVRNSWLFVDFFFLLSGFVIAWNYAGRLNSRSDVRRFLVLRLGRLYPLHLFALFCLFVYEAGHFANGMRHLFPIATFTGDRSLSALLSNIFLVQSLHIHDHFTWIVPSWSISTEFWTYFSFALVSAWCGVRTWMLVITITLLPIVLFAVSEKGLDVTYDYGFIRCVFGFAVGVLCCRVYSKRQLLLGKLYFKTYATLFECLVTVAIFYYVSFVGRTDWSLFAPFVFALAILVFAADAGFISRVFRLPPFRWLGSRSYSIYLTHYLIVIVVIPSGVSLVEKYLLHSSLRSTMAINVRESAPVFGRNNLEGFFFYAVMIALTLILSSATYRWVEKPGRAWARSKVN